eukprot:TRINITY_DN3045_c0_g1_i1.p1 TRINITY_DN3045_c0_g1~~TRINITY_DN3045_c0_g1_i1.p1  ORF type:complete len:281 (-),score=86.08 TRINITY_DN3045_c0_g1_i1:62-904(-)
METTEIKPYRFYENSLPNEGDIVTARIDSFTDYAVEVTLLEYNGIQGSIQFSQISNKRIRQAPHKLLKIGTNEILQVLSVDEEKKYVELSRNNITPKEKDEAELRFIQSKNLHGILSYVSTALDVSIKSLYKNVVWPLCRNTPAKHPFAVLKSAIGNPSVTFWDVITIDEKVKQTLMQILEHRVGPLEMKVQAAVEVTCFAEEGVDAIMSALSAAEKLGDDKEKVKVTLVATPVFALTTSTTNFTNAAGLLNSAIEVVKKEIEMRKGNLVVKAAPAVLVF